MWTCVDLPAPGGRDGTQQRKPYPVASSVYQGQMRLIEQLIVLTQHDAIGVKHLITCNLIKREYDSATRSFTPPLERQQQPEQITNVRHNQLK